jgi:hypothetical protein
VSLTTQVPPRVNTLFPSGEFDAQRVVRHSTADILASLRNEEVRAIVVDLHRRMNLGEDTQVEIDRYMLYMHLEVSGSLLLERLPWRNFVLRAEDVPGMVHMPDIGREIREMLLFMPTKSSMHKVLQYSMPYIKHNRLNFPAFADISAQDLTHMIRIVMACCLGVLRANTKRPVFELRVRLYAFFHELLARGSSADHYCFCVANLCLLRVAMIEFFIIFMHKFMPAEKLVLCERFQLNNTTDALFHNFCLIFDTFRQTAMQVRELDFAGINARAHIAIEKCNRVTKGKNRPNHMSPTLNVVASSTTTLDLAMRSARFAHHSYASLQPMMRSQSWPDIVAVQRIHGVVSVHSLPANLMRMQARHLADVCRVNSNCISQSTLLFVCLRCACSAAKFVLDKKLRVMSDGQCFCTECDNSTYVLRICTLGRIVQVRSQCFYFCKFCCSTHEWVSTGHEFCFCPRILTAKTVLKPPSCCICSRSTSLSALTVLDDKMGILRDLNLCPKHKPLAHQQDAVYNIQTLRKAVLHKLNRYKVSALEITQL